VLIRNKAALAAHLNNTVDAGPGMGRSCAIEDRAKGHAEDRSLLSNGLDQGTKEDQHEL